MQALEPSILTIFGITGDLASRYLLPAIYDLTKHGHLTKSFKILGISRRNTTVDDILNSIKKSVEASGKICDTKTLIILEKSISILKMDITKPEEYKRLKNSLDSVEDAVGVCQNRLYYLAIPPTLFEPIVERLGQYDLNKGCQHGRANSRLLIEKPFGYNLESAAQLINKLRQCFDEEQIYRIDHYLAKETAQNILTFRFENPIFQNSWDSKHISYITITAAESIGIEGRVSFYEKMGAMRDLIQSHLLQLLALITMEKPAKMTARDIHLAKEKVLKAISPPKDNEIEQDTVRGQYKTYKEETQNANTSVETFAAIKLNINNSRWQGTPVFLRNGKALAKRVTEITIVYKDKDVPSCTNSLNIRIQPNEGVTLDLKIKKPGLAKETQNVEMDFSYSDLFDMTNPNAYIKVLVDAINGDKTLFASSEEVLTSWKITEPILDAWSTSRCKLHIYQNGTWGPVEANDLIERYGGKWNEQLSSDYEIHTKKREVK